MRVPELLFVNYLLDWAVIDHSYSIRLNFNLLENNLKDPMLEKISYRPIPTLFRIKPPDP